MRIERLKIENFRAIHFAEFLNVGDAILIAGDNGSGKSCVLDAIRLLKSSYAGYRAKNELEQFFNELGINYRDTSEWSRLFFQTNLPIHIEADIRITPNQVDFIRNNAREILTRHSTETTISGQMTYVIPGANGTSGSFNSASAREQIACQIEIVHQDIIAAISEGTYSAQLTIDPMCQIKTSKSPVLELIFANYDPQELGIIEYHGATRTYPRSRIGGINLNPSDSRERMAQHALYNTNNKYGQIKEEVAVSYIKDLLLGQSKPDPKPHQLMDTLSELFEKFVPGKSFKGPEIDRFGNIAFPVQLDSGGSHDIDDLSSGEKEIVYGYLRVRNLSPRNSIIMLDEPELHLNPRAISGLAEFYRKNLGRALGNQIWLTTHSDVFLRDAVGTREFTAYHVLSAQLTEPGENQATEIKKSDHITKAVISLVGDLATYRPKRPIIVFESSQDADFDKSFVEKLFPELPRRATLISGDSKSGVKNLKRSLDIGLSLAQTTVPVYAIVDADEDVDSDIKENASGVYSWDVYHIENYLLSPDYIRQTMSIYSSIRHDLSEKDIDDALRVCAKKTIRSFATHKLRNFAYRKLRECIHLGNDSDPPEPADLISRRVSRAFDSVKATTDADLSPVSISERYTELEQSLSASLNDGSWRKRFRGRDILKCFCHKYCDGMEYTDFRDAIINQMKVSNHKPEGMQAVLDRINI